MPSTYDNVNDFAEILIDHVACVNSTITAYLNGTQHEAFYGKYEKEFAYILKEVAKCREIEHETDEIL